MSRGILFFAINNDKLDYLKLAYLSGLLIKKNMGDISISIVTNTYSLNWDFYKKNENKFKKIFDNIIILNETENQKNTRVYRDTSYHSITANFNNISRINAYDLSPYDETLLLDVDYFIMSDVLNHVWGCNEDILINHKAKSLSHEFLTGPEFRLNDYGIKMFWATAIYFKKSKRAKLLFEFVKHIKEHWDFYKLVYDFPSSLYRNDYAFSIAIHVLNGFLENDEVKSLPIDYILTLTDKDQFFEMINKNEMKVFVNDQKEPWKFFISKLKCVDVHCMNKLSLFNNFDNILKAIENE